MSFLHAKRPHAHVAKRQEPQGKTDDFQSIVKQAKFLYETGADGESYQAMSELGCYGVCL